MDPRVEEVPDNVADEPAVAPEPATPAEPVPEPPAAEPEKPAPAAEPVFECISEITTAVFKHYADSDMPVKSCKFRAPMQLVDGCVCDILAPNGSTLATCRLRFKNRANIVSDRGDLRLELYMTDLAFPRADGGIEFRLK